MFASSNWVEVKLFQGLVRQREKEKREGIVCESLRECVCVCVCFSYSNQKCGPNVSIWAMVNYHKMLAVIQSPIILAFF